MPEYDDDDTEFESDEETVSINRSQLRQLRKLAKQSEEAQAEIAEFKRMQVFEQAGFDLTEPMNAMFYQTYEGDMDAASIRSEASKYGWTFEDGDDVEDYDLSGSDVSGGGTMQDDLEDAFRAATSQDDLNDRISRIYRAHGETVATDM